MSTTLLRQTLIKKKIDIFVDFLIFIHFHYMKMIDGQLGCTQYAISHVYIEP